MLLTDKWRSSRNNFGTLDFERRPRDVFVVSPEVNSIFKGAPMNRSNIRGLVANGKTSGELDPSRLAFSMREVGAALGVSERSIWTLINCGKLPSFRVGRSVRVRREDLENFMRNGGTSA